MRGTQGKHMVRCVGHGLEAGFYSPTPYPPDLARTKKKNDKKLASKLGIFLWYISLFLLHNLPAEPLPFPLSLSRAKCARCHESFQVLRQRLHAFFWMLKLPLNLRFHDLPDHWSFL